VETRVAVIRFRREERDAGARCELCGVVQLQTCVRKPGRQIGVNRLPGANTETSSLCRVLGGELHRIDRFEKLYQHTRVRSLSQANDATLDYHPFAIPSANEHHARYSFRMSSVRVLLGLSFCALLTTDCTPAAREAEVPARPTRSYFMGFSVIPPRPDIKVAVQSMEICTKRADA